MVKTDLLMAKWARKRTALAEQIADLEARKKFLDKKIIERMERRGIKGLKLDDGKVNITYVRGSNIVYDVEEFKARLSPKLFRQVTEPRINTGALAVAIGDGDISPEDMAKCSEVKWQEPYIRVSIND